MGVFLVQRLAGQVQGCLHIAVDLAVCLVHFPHNLRLHPVQGLPRKTLIHHHRSIVKLCRAVGALGVDDFTRILTEPKASLTEQYSALMFTEGVTLDFAEDSVRRIAEIAFQVNENTENIGARRLHTIMERLLDVISYEAPDRNGEHVTIDADYVNEHLDELASDEDLSRYIL